MSPAHRPALLGAVLLLFTGVLSVNISEITLPDCGVRSLKLNRLGHRMWTLTDNVTLGGMLSISMPFHHEYILCLLRIWL